MSEREIDALIDDWIGELDRDGKAAPQKVARWWRKDAVFDAYLRETYGGRLEQARRGELTDWERSACGKLALILLLDQLSRNIHRDGPGMYAGDEAALALAARLLDSGEAETLEAMQRYFVFMPFMHSEKLEHQRRCEALFEAEAAACSPALRELFESGHDYATRHRVIVERFGRFPHRNELLGRESTAEELDFLQEPGSSF